VFHFETHAAARMIHIYNALTVVYVGEMEVRYDKTGIYEMDRTAIVPPEGNVAFAHNDWVEKIDGAIGNNLLAVFAVGNIIVAAKNELPKDGYRQVIARSGIKSVSTANNYKRVAEKLEFKDPDVARHLPPTVGVLIDLVKWSKEQLMRAIEEKILTPAASRKNLKKWKKETFPEPSTAKDKDGRLVAYVIAHRDYNSEQMGDASEAEDDTTLANFIHEINAFSPDQRFLVSVVQEKSFSELRFSYLRRRVVERLKADKDAYERERLKEIFGDFESPVIDSGIGKLVESGYAVTRSRLKLTEDELQFLIRYTASRGAEDTAQEEEKKAA